MHRIMLFQIGIGNVGREVLRQTIEFNRDSHTGIIDYTGIANRNSVICRSGDGDEGWLREILSSTQSHIRLTRTGVQKHHGELFNLFRALADPFPGNHVIVDTTDSTGVIPFLRRCAESGIPIVLANKKPLVGEISLFRELNRVRLGCRATVGAGLPVIPAIQGILKNNEMVVRVEGCFSGTLGILCSALEEGSKFSRIVKEATGKGYTEPDPREDLSGMDVTRKILIIARLCGINAEISDIQTEALFPGEMNSLSPEAFLGHLPSLDNIYSDRFAEAIRHHATLRYVATLDRGRCTVSLKEVPVESEMGKLKGAGKVALIYTDKRRKDPLIIRGKGAGAISAAQDVLNDILFVSGLNELE